jgi:hypothetical protein
MKITDIPEYDPMVLLTSKEPMTNTREFVDFRIPPGRK